MVAINMLRGRFVRVTGLAEAFACISTRGPWVLLTVLSWPHGPRFDGRARKVSPWVAI